MAEQAFQQPICPTSRICSTALVPPELPTGVMISHRNLQVNFEQLMRSFFADSHVKAPSNITIVSWLPFYHDMGLVLGVCAPILGGYRGELTSPVSFLERPARWVRSLAENRHCVVGGAQLRLRLGGPQDKRP